MESNKRVLIWFFALTFLLSWAIWVPALTQSLGWPGYTVPGYGLVGAIMPGIAALIVAAFSGGRAAVRALFRQVLVWRVGPGWYGFAVLLRPVMIAGAFFGAGLWRGSPLPATEFSIVALVVMLLIQTPNTLMEEVGWRGYALPRMAGTRGWLFASLGLGVIWGTWHLPYWATADNTRLYGPVSIVLFFTMVVAGSVVFAWLYKNTRSVLLPWLMHLATNTAVAFLPLSASEVGSMWPFAVDTLLVVMLAVAAGASLARADRASEGVRGGLAGSLRPHQVG